MKKIPKKTKHIHKYIRRNIGTKEKPTERYCCADSSCTHFMPSLQLVIGKDSICWECGDVFQISIDQVQNLIKKPRCYECRTKKQQPDVGEHYEDTILDAAIDLSTKTRL